MCHKKVFSSFHFSLLAFKFLLDCQWFLSWNSSMHFTFTHILLLSEVSKACSSFAVHLGSIVMSWMCCWCVLRNFSFLLSTSGNIHHCSKKTWNNGEDTGQDNGSHCGFVTTLDRYISLTFFLLFCKFFCNIVCCLLEAFCLICKYFFIAMHFHSTYT